MTRPETAQRAYSALINAGVQGAEAQRLLAALSTAGIGLSDETDDELVVRWVDVQAQPVPPDADTIIRTITTTRGEQSWSSTHWLAGLRGPRHVPQLK
jgi:hypothetical protein